MTAAGVNALLGVVVLVFGRKLFWVFVGVAGFLAGLNFAERFLAAPEMLRLLIAVVAGIIGAVLAIFLQKVAIAIAGFLMGGYIVVQLLHAVMQPVAWDGIAYIVGGILGAVLVLLLFDWALILLSSLSGALLVVDSLPLESAARLLVFVVLLVAGILIQSAMMRRTAGAGP
jgi:hypothetical protein